MSSESERRAEGGGETPAAGDQARRIGRGGIYLTFTKLYFIASSYLIYFALPAIGGLALLGGYGTVNAYLSLLSTVLITGTVQAVARFVGKEPEAARAVRAQAFQLQLMLGVAAAMAFFFLAPGLEENPDLSRALRVAAAIPLAYALYSVFMGTLNGQRRFAEQAALDAGFTTAKVLFVILGAYLLGSVTGAFLGFLSAAVLVLLAGGLLTNRGLGPKGAGGGPGIVRLFLFQMQTVGFMLCVQWTVQVDLLYLGWFDAFSGNALDDARGVYKATQLFSQISYSLVISVVFVLFPLVSASNMKERPEEVRRFVKEALRYALIMVTGVAAVLSSTPRAAIGLLPNTDKIELIGAWQTEGLRWLAVGYVFFALLFIVCSVLNAAGSPRLSILLMVCVAVIQFLGAWLLIRDHQLVGLGVAGMVAMGTGCLLGLALLHRFVGGVVPWATLGRVLVAGAAVYGVAVLWHPPGKLMTVLRFVLEGGLYLAVILLLREFKAADKDKFMSVIGRGGVRS